MNGPAAAARISVVIPSWRDSESLEKLLPALTGLERIGEIIVVEASGDPKTEELARACGAKFVACACPNRGEQMNLGA
ncbi:MAG TPA: hypothetical protein VJS88_04495, partial [Chthoniobacterales bacterium]|nr:hypothetical protein [Chthoniobacterales bacterium]